MAPPKRARPAFSPPRPGKSKATTTTAQKKGITKTVSKSTKADSSKRTNPTPKRSRYTSATESESDSQGGNDTTAEDDEEEELEAEGEDEDENMQDETNTLSSSDGDNNNNNNNESSPEPDYILAEITHEKDNNATDPSNSIPVIPLPLMHRILHAHFAKPDKTKISMDAREVVGKYFEVFVREAIMRCAYEKNGGSHAVDNEDDDGGGHNVNDAGVTGNNSANTADGWLEVDDLEKVAVQLCLDF